MEKHENDIHNATPKRIAELLEDLARRIVKTPRQYKDFEDEHIEALHEAARRLVEREKPTFNHKTIH